MSNIHLNTFKLSRVWFDFSFENPDKVKPIDTALYFYIIDLNNRLGGKQKFGLPTNVSTENLGISKPTFLKALNNLVEWKFIIMIKKSTNRYNANIIQLGHVNFSSQSLNLANTLNQKNLNANDNANFTANDNANFTANDNANFTANDNANFTIDKPINQLTNKPINQLTNNLKSKSKKNTDSPDSLNSKKEKVCNGALKNKNQNKEKSTPKKEINYNEILQIFNSVCVNLPKIQKITRARKTKINHILKHYGNAELGKCFAMVANTPFLNGNNDKGWTADFDWIINENNFIKILENKYKSNAKNTTNNGRKLQYSDDFKRKITSKIQS